MRSRSRRSRRSASRRVALVGSMPTRRGIAVLSRDVQRAMRVARIAPRVAARALEAWGRRPPPPTGDPSNDDAYARGPARVVPARRPVARARARLPRPAVGLRARRRQAPVTLWWGEDDTVCVPVDRRVTTNARCRTRPCGSSRARTRSSSAAGGTSSRTSLALWNKRHTLDTVVWRSSSRAEVAFGLASAGA